MHHSPDLSHARLGISYGLFGKPDPVRAAGARPGVLSTQAGSEQRQFFDRLPGAGRDAFDVFDVHLYGNPYRIPSMSRQRVSFMRAHGYLRMLVAGE